MNYVRIQVWIDELRDGLAFSILHRERRSLEEIAGWRDRYYILRCVYFIACLFVFGSLPSWLGWVLFSLSALLLQALYFSIVTASTVGFGDLHPLHSTGPAYDGSPAPVSHSGLFLVVVQLVMVVLFVLVFVNIFLTRSLNLDQHRETGPGP